VSACMHIPVLYIFECVHASMCVLMNQYEHNLSLSLSFTQAPVETSMGPLTLVALDREEVLDRQLTAPSSDWCVHIRNI